MCRVLVGVVLLVLLALAAAIVYLPWWGSLLLIATLVLLAKPVGALLFARLILAPIRMKSAALRGADLLVNAVEATVAPTGVDEPEDDDEPVTPAEPLAWYWLDLTITPHLAQGARFTHWEPGDLSLAHPDAKPPSMRDDEGPEDVGQVHEVLVWSNGAFGPDEEGKYEGPQRVRLLAAIKPEATLAKLRYYLEFLGEVRFPGMVDAG
ncbi:MAG: hypothetical protein HZB16_06660 [Armatimonadetes bacterium]|nr:hypothetical protein [Armatimonadota bacterium]